MGFFFPPVDRVTWTIPFKEWGSSGLDDPGCDLSSQRRLTSSGWSLLDNSSLNSHQKASFHVVRRLAVSVSWSSLALLKSIHINYLFIKRGK